MSEQRAPPPPSPPDSRRRCRPQLNAELSCRIIYLSGDGNVDATGEAESRGRVWPRRLPSEFDAKPSSLKPFSVVDLIQPATTSTRSVC